MPYHHYLPATFLAAFAVEGNKPRRERKIFIGDKSNYRCFVSSVGNVAGENNLYLVPSSNSPTMIENTWSKYETQLPIAIQKLIDGTVNAVQWARIMVPFVASLFVRTRNFDTRFENRLRAIGFEDTYFERHPDNTNTARLMELQRLLAPVLAAKWIVLRKVGKTPLITNDVGYAPFRHMSITDAGFAIPLDKDHILVVIPKRERDIIEVREGDWFPLIEYAELSSNNHFGLNKALVSNAQRFVFGSDEALIRRLLQEESRLSSVVEPAELGFIAGTLAMVHEFTWHRLVSTLSKNPGDESAWSFDLDFGAIAAGWYSPVAIPINLPEFPPALRRDGNKIIVSFYDVQGLTT